MSNIIIQKLNSFIRSYYKNLVIRGVVYTSLLLIIFFVVLAVVEYFGWQSQNVRTVIFYTYFLLAAVILFVWVIVPLAKIFSIGKTISHKQAAKIIGEYFPEIKDKLLNLLELQELSTFNNNDNTLLLAAIEQKTLSLSPIPFYKAINKSKTKRYAKILLGVIAVFVCVCLCFPKLFSEPATRYINHNIFYQKPAPFHFVFDPDIVEAVQHNDIEIKVGVKGEMLPDKVNVIINGQPLEMKKKDKTHFLYTITQIQKTTTIQFEAVGIKSQLYTINVSPKPVLTDLTAEIIYPQYTGIKKEIINNITDISIAEGSVINWTIRSKDAEQVLFKSNENLQKLEIKKDLTKHSVKYLSSQSISIKMKNSKTLSMDSLAFFVNVVKDEKPQISVIEERENDLADKIYFRGQIKDDYGFSLLEFHLKKTSDNKVTDYKRSLPITTEENAQEFYYLLDLGEYEIKTGDRIEYYFEVWDNDQIHGAKSTKSQNFNISIPDNKEIEQRVENNTQDINKQTDNTLKELKDLQKKINELTKKLTETKELTWKDKQELEELKNRQEQIRESIKNVREKIGENTSLEEKYKNTNKELLNKQIQIEQLFEKLENKELKDLMKQIEQLTKQNLNKEKLNENLQQLQEKNEELSKQLDKNLELYKRLDVEKNINDAIDKLQELSDKQEKLAKETSNKNIDKNELAKQQEQLNKEFKDLQQKMSEIEKKDASLEDPFEFKREKEQEQAINQEMQKAKENIDKNKKNNAVKNQKNASQQMQQMAENMANNMEENEQEQLAEDIDNVRQILKNLVTLSKEEESLIYSSQHTQVNDPAYQNIINKQNAIKESMKDIADSLYSMSKRQPQISNTIYEQTHKVRENINSSLDKLLKYNQSVYNSLINTQASSSQQYAMTSMNNLALLLAESLDNMNQQQAQSKQSSKSSNKQCKNPSSSSGGKKSVKNMKQMQEALNKEIQRLQKELEKQGNKPHKIGESRQLNEELAKAAAQQEMIRKMMEQYLQEQKEMEGKAAGNINKALKQMEETEKDIVNKKINANTIKRQNEILTRMLESERAEKTREKDNERKSTIGIDKKQDDKENFEAFKKLKNRDMELFREIPPVYSPYYKTKINEYFYNLE